MVDNLREQASFTEDEEHLNPNDPRVVKPPKVRRTFDQVTGMSAAQRFILLVMLSVMVVLLGTMFLVLSGKVVPPF